MAPSSQERAAREARTRLRDYQARQTAHTERIRRRVRDNVIAVVVVVVLIAGVTAAQLFYFSGGPGTPVAAPSASATPEATPSATPTAEAGQNTGDVPPTSVAEGRDWTGTLTINDIPLGLQLDGTAAPQAVSAFISQAQSGFLTNTTCHRLTTSGIYVLQCGDPTGTGTGGPGYSYGPVENAPADDVYPAGTLAMARQGGNGYSMGSQFFIVYQDSTIPSDAAGGYTVLGQITSGLDALQSGVIAAGTADGGGDGAPKTTATITSVTVQ
ncbi:peptidylprolyl isomerase [Herbiconiux solani]|uniref:peptidylprolyl isomerase n=1 Tax=Herbiconiux solani TaxID=661329 RepID=UPI0008251D79|nr:peptidylprolyl isomerase [Herbiconiux solani]